MTICSLFGLPRIVVVVVVVVVVLIVIVVVVRIIVVVVVLGVVGIAITEPPESHVLVHFVKFFGAYNVKSSSTLFSDNIQ